MAKLLMIAGYSIILLFAVSVTDTAIKTSILALVMNIVFIYVLVLLEVIPA